MHTWMDGATQWVNDALKCAGVCLPYCARPRLLRCCCVQQRNRAALQRGLLVKLRRQLQQGACPADAGAAPHTLDTACQLQVCRGALRSRGRLACC